MFAGLSPYRHRYAGRIRRRATGSRILPAERRVLRALAALGVVLVGAAINPVDLAFAGNPYSGILQRNAFGLRPPSPVLKETPHAPLPKVHLTGITTILKGKRALLKVEFPGKPSERRRKCLTFSRRANARDRFRSWPLMRKLRR